MAVALYRTLSALNTWIGEEVRLTGLDAMVVRKTGRGDRLEVAGAVFGVNEPAGALLAWRGWSFGDRLTGAGERLPLPPLRSFEPGQAFADQADRTRPIDDLAHRIGWHARARGVPGALGSGRYNDQRGGRDLHDGQYSWQTIAGPAARSEARIEPPRGRGAIGDRAWAGGSAVRTWKCASRRRTPCCPGRGDTGGARRVSTARHEDRDATAGAGRRSGSAARWRRSGSRATACARPRVRRRSAEIAGAASGVDPDMGGRRPARGPRLFEAGPVTAHSDRLAWRYLRSIAAVVKAPTGSRPSRRCGSAVGYGKRR